MLDTVPFVSDPLGAIRWTASLTLVLDPFGSAYPFPAFSRSHDGNS